MPYALEAENLDFSYRREGKILDGVSFAIEEGSYVALVGPNGAGKTTLLKLILGLLKPETGNIKILGQDSRSFATWDLVGYLPQQSTAFNPLFPATAKEVVALGRIGAKSKPRRLGKQDWLAVQRIMDELGISDLADRRIGQLSGGQQQRVFLARALVSSPRILILDEPSTALDPQARESFFNLIEKINREKGTTILLITHDISHIKHHAASLLYLDRRLMFYGPCDENCLKEHGHHHLGHYL